MKKTNYIALILIICMAFCLALTACGRNSGGSSSNAPAEKQEEAVVTLESYVAKDSSFWDELKKAMDTNEGLTIEIKGNDIIYSYDMTVLSSDTETLKSDIMKEALGSAIEEQKALFADLCKTAEDQTGIKGIQAVVNYTAGEELLISRTFTSADAE